jgi:hypothetical protein
MYQPRSPLRHPKPPNTYTTRQAPPALASHPFLFAQRCIRPCSWATPSPHLAGNSSLARMLWGTPCAFMTRTIRKPASSGAKSIYLGTNLQSLPHSWRELIPPSISNFYPAPIVIEGDTYATSEHYFQSRKFTNNLAIRALILAAPTPAEAFALAHAHEGDVVADWHTHHKKRDMFRAVIFKFKQHPQLQVGCDTHSRI